jgi:glc operon protein GlcG
MRQRYVLTHADAQRVLAAIQSELEANSEGAAVAVTDSHGELIAFVRTDGCPLPSINNAINKAYTASRQRQPSSEVGASSRENGWPLSNFGDMRYIGWGGGVPLVYEGTVVGAVGVSGLPETRDAELARLGASAL